MRLVMCRSCGEFVPAEPATDPGETPAPMPSECPECGATEFKDVRSDEDTTTD